MASGQGYHGGRSRCYPFWQEFAKCYAKADYPSECIAQKEDYVECLHHTQQKARNTMIRSQLLKAMAREAKEGKRAAEVKATSSPIGLGLIGEEKIVGPGLEAPESGK